jgi:hypothetical protein
LFVRSTVGGRKYVKGEHRVRRILRENGLSIVVLSIFLLFLGAESVAGWQAYNDDLRDHGKAVVGYWGFISSGRFIEATTENWESEFLEMAAYAVLTALLFQKGSAESRRLTQHKPEQCSQRSSGSAPWPVRRGGWLLKVYEYSLTLGFLLLFLASFLLHAYGGTRDYNLQQTEHGGPAVSMWQFMGTAHFWFQSFQNWQSEFLGLASIVILSIFLRQRGSPQSKPVEAPNSETGTD